MFEYILGICISNEERTRIIKKNRYEPPSRSKSAPTRKHQQPNRPANASPRTRRQISSGEKEFLAGTAVNPHQRLVLEKGSREVSVRAVDLICPIGLGQRALIVSAPGLGKTTLLKHICQAVVNGYPEMKVYCVLVDERPEEVTDFVRSVNAEVFSSSMDHSHENHIKIVDQVVERAFGEAAAGHHVMILIDSLTRLARVHNAQRASGGRIMSGGVGAGALETPRRIFGAARNVEGLGSITIIATILVDTGSRMDEVIYEEFKGTGNMELTLSADLSQLRIFPAIDIVKSSTRRAELLYPAEQYQSLERLRRALASLEPAAAMQKMLALLSTYASNDELLQSIEKALG